jgi:hypothetical protein
MKVLQCFILASVALILSCSSERKFDEKIKVGLLRLDFIDSVLVLENPVFIGPTSHHEFVNDTTLVVSSYRTPGVWAINPKNGKIRSEVLSGEVFESNFFPAGLNVHEYPKIQILDPKQKRIFTFDLEGKKFIKKVKLNLPERYSFRTIESLFLFSNGYYFIDIYPSFDNQTSLNFYNQDRKIIGVFDSDGELISTQIEFPDSYKRLKDPIMPFKTHIGLQFKNEPKLIFSMGERIINLGSDSIQNNKPKETPLPNTSKFFDFEFPKLIQPFNPDIERYLNFPSSHFFDKAIENENYFILQSEMRDNSKLGNYSALSHLFVFTKKSERWSETDQAFDINKLGMISGVVNDTLVFFDGTMKNSNNKYIKRAVLKTIGD